MPWRLRRTPRKSSENHVAILWLGVHRHSPDKKMSHWIVTPGSATILTVALWYDSSLRGKDAAGNAENASSPSANNFDVVFRRFPATAYSDDKTLRILA